MVGNPEKKTTGVYRIRVPQNTRINQNNGDKRRNKLNSLPTGIFSCKPESYM